MNWGYLKLTPCAWAKQLGTFVCMMLGAERRSCAQYKHRKHDHLIFYDSWVARDLAGIPFANTRPFVLHQYSLARLQQGLPFPVSCCWNGMAILNGAFFQQGYQFRSADEISSRRT